MNNYNPRYTHIEQHNGRQFTIVSETGVWFDVYAYGRKVNKEHTLGSKWEALNAVRSGKYDSISQYGYYAPC